MKASVTQIGLAPTRLPAPARLKLLDLARRGIGLLRLADELGARLVVHLCDGLERALIDLAVAEERLVDADRTIAASNTRVGELLREVARLKALSFEEPTAKRDSSASIAAELAEFEGQSTVVRG